MSDYKNGNYCAFYVSGIVNQTNLGVNTSPDFAVYRMLEAWKGLESTFPFIDSHDKTYNVRDDSDWEKTLKPRLHQRLNKSKNIIFILSSDTRDSRALHEELDYGINTLNLPVIVIYREFKEKTDIVDSLGIKQQIKKLWDLVPIFKNSKHKVRVLHIPYNKTLITSALQDTESMIQTVGKTGDWWYKL
ncbi:MAG: TIR domain-containing protein [Alphaproteobacteria bacterium]|jgi:hypothetical protein